MIIAGSVQSLLLLHASADSIIEAVIINETEPIDIFCARRLYSSSSFASHFYRAMLRSARLLLFIMKIVHKVHLKHYEGNSTEKNSSLTWEYAYECRVTVTVSRPSVRPSVCLSVSEWSLMYGIYMYKKAVLWQRNRTMPS